MKKCSRSVYIVQGGFYFTLVVSAQRLARHCQLFFIRDKFKLNRFDIGLSRAPAPTPKFYRRKIAVALCGLYLV
ncbi:hypothetical protein [Ruminococcus bicirculans (ex Wegman et al. 2014)]|uniref:hypothetical protein n=1 Tax=Ruminococcus bicirculans (ex Wegman et al. 2014) TaxID=1160721 RepID=UPI00241FDBD4|nr:hypothetical protein [Ruminococcus bicirculans (ex Wegman et al. 2014)]